MSRMSKIFWGEGLFLRPQHFQRQDAYHEERLQALAGALHPYAWGVREAQFDAQALAAGVLRAQRLSAVFADGEVYDAPSADELPEALAMDRLAAGVGATTIHLGLPLLRAHGGNCGEGDGSTVVRYRQDNKPTADLYTDAGEAELSFLRKNVRLLLDAEPRDAFVTVPVARVRRVASGGFELDDDFMPPVIAVSASGSLQDSLRRLLDNLQAKTEALRGMHREPSRSVIEFRSGDVASFWLLHTVNAGFAALSHLSRHPGLHPERLHQELARLAGGLLTFSGSHTLADLPPYRHDQPEPGFSRLFDIIRELLGTVISERYFSIALEEVKPSFHVGRLDSQRIDERSSLYVAVGADLPGTELVQTVPVRFKVGAPDDVEKCVLSALPGLKLLHAAQVPAAIPVRPGSQYFQVEPRGPLYERMLKSQSVTIYVPAGIRDLRLELLALTA